MSKIGLREIKEYMKGCDDPMVVAIYDRLVEARRSNARLNLKVADLERQYRETRDELMEYICMDNR